MSDEESTKNVHSVSIKAPAFMEESVNGWFAIMEAQFHLKNLTVSTTKFYTVLAALPPDVVSKLPVKVLEDKDYKELKSAIVSIYEKTKPELLDKLMKICTLSGRPSVYLQELSTIANSINVGDDIVRHKFISALPTSIAPVIASQRELNLNQLGRLADELMPLLNQHSVMAVEKQDEFERSRPPRRNNYDNFSSHPSSSNNHSSQVSSSIPIGLRPFSSNQKPKVCRTHLYFGSNARYCKPWCKWPNKQGIQMHPSSRPGSPVHSRNASESNSNLN